MLFGKNGPHQADDGASVGEDTDHVASPSDLPVEAFLVIVGPDLPPVLDREGTESGDVRGSFIQHPGDIGKAAFEPGDHPLKLGFSR